MPEIYADTLRETLREGRIPRLYTDTSVILDFLEPQRRPESVRLLDGAIARNWNVLSSYFALMEAFDVEHRRLRESRGRDLSERELDRVSRRFRRLFVDEYKDYIEWIFLEEDGWQPAVNFSALTNMSARDCVHLVTASTARCDVLVTSDDQFGRWAQLYIPTALPGQLLQFMQTLKG